jgi:Protein of unknown function (DUF2905)
MDVKQFGLVLILAGAVAVAAGLLLWSGWLGWFGHLPGDIRIEGESTRVYIPLTSMIIVSVALTLLINLVRRVL